MRPVQDRGLGAGRSAPGGRQKKVIFQHVLPVGRDIQLVTSLERILDIVHFHLGTRHSENPLMLKTYGQQNTESEHPALHTTDLFFSSSKQKDTPKPHRLHLNKDSMLTVEINESDAAFHNERDNLAGFLGREMETREGWVTRQKLHKELTASKRVGKVLHLNKGVFQF